MILKSSCIAAFLVFINAVPLNCQNADAEGGPGAGQSILSGFIRGGFYGALDRQDKNKPYFQSAYSDLALKISLSNDVNFKAFTDVRYRYGVEFSEAVSAPDFREGYVKLYGRKWDFTAGQQIIKWGRGDFTNPSSNLSPVNLVSRSPDREDMNMGNIIARIDLYPAEWLKLEGDLVPFYRPSVLIIDPYPFPDNVQLNQQLSLSSGRELITYGLKADFGLKGIDLGISWFEGHDPMPGISLTSFSLDLTSGIPITNTVLDTKSYKTRVASLDLETAFGAAGFRAETALSFPDLDYREYEYVPLPELCWVAGSDFSTGVFRFTAEYSGKYVIDFTPSLVEPVLGTEPDYSELIPYLQDPGFNPEDYAREQVAAFNRLYNYQLNEYSHSAGLRAEAEFLHGRMLSSVFTMYNFTTRETLVIPEIKFKPTDGIAITSGAEFYTGKEGSLFDIISDFMNTVYLSLRVDF
jgi:hypothetical protein